VSESEASGEACEANEAREAWWQQKTLWKRAHTLSGILLALFLLEHYFTNAFILKGPGYFNDKVALLESLPFLPLIEICMLLIPFLIHIGYGLHIIHETQFNFWQYPTLKNWTTTFLHVSGIYLIVFVLYHVYNFRIVIAGGLVNDTNSHLAGKIFYAHLVDHMQVTWVFLFYCVSVFIAPLHMWHGLGQVFASLGLVRGDLAQKKILQGCIAMGILMGLLGIYIIYTLHWKDPNIAGTRAPAYQYWLNGQEYPGSEQPSFETNN